MLSQLTSLVKIQDKPTVLDNMALKLMDNLWIQENLQMIIKHQLFYKTSNG